MPLERLPKLCVCGDSFNLQNASIEPLLTPLTEEDFLNLQIRATKQEQMCQLEVWGVNEQTACDGSTFKLLARCYLNRSLAAAHKKNENEEKREYNQRILQVEHRSLTPLAFSCFGEMRRE